MDLLATTLNEEHPVFDQLARDWARLRAWSDAPTALLPLAEAREVRRHRGPTRWGELAASAERLLTRWPGGSRRAVDLLVFTTLSAAYLAVVVGLVLAARGA